MDYLVYVEYNAENLQFYLWFKDYTKRFNALSENEKALSKEWFPDTKEAPDLTKDAEKAELKKSTRQGSVANIMESGYAAKEAAMFSEDESPFAMTNNMSLANSTASLAGSSVPSNADVTAQAGLKWQPCMHPSPTTMYQN